MGVFWPFIDLCTKAIVETENVFAHFPTFLPPVNPPYIIIIINPVVYQIHRNLSQVSPDILM
jgi:hypothetical protein